ncbi:hypothetical protein [Paracraurococcus ruber]|uniref:Uncharacterized protein n=1 Tax=Paracraurococcus ruber TaxID=77675 RepID=A0ABS1D656_9PROT|nr:hypothetical protein [Paracraurococcus ruber]MBK1662370.1 hypothetical protein [Paracraurococcus ruber]TDG25758.1 hypothetical protein E2C05_25575 [Paracraurococcus ruber]
MAMAQDLSAPKPGIEVARILDVLQAKQTQHDTLWAGYAVIQFTAAGFGEKSGLSTYSAVFVLLGFWGFNLGHLGFVLQCARQIGLYAAAPRAAVDRETDHEAKLATALRETDASGYVFAVWSPSRMTSTSFWNSAVHLFIDTCASVSLRSHVTR